MRRAFLVPTVASSVEETEQTRISFKQRIRDVTEITLAGGSTWIDDRSDLFRVAHGISNIEDIRRVPMLSGALREWTSIQVPHFYMHYLGFHDLPIQKEVAHMFSLLCPSQLFEVSPHLADILSSKSHQRKKRIGFVSSLIGGDEPHGLLVLDVIRSLQGLFEFFVVSVGSKPPSSDFFHATNGNVFQVGYDDNAARNLLKSLELDCLVYAEAMNEAIVYFLGYQRFAKVQILVMGSPVSSGIPTFDYFISGDLLEHVSVATC